MKKRMRKGFKLTKKECFYFKIKDKVPALSFKEREIDRKGN